MTSTATSTTATTSTCTVELPNFTGPLDLLLSLVREHKLDLFNLPIAFVTDRYLEYLDQLRQVNVDLAAEYLVMAAELALLKSRMLLPPGTEPEEAQEEEEDPRARLVRRLLIYSKYKDAAERLAARALLGYQVFARPAVAARADARLDAAEELAEGDPVELVSYLVEIIKRSKKRLPAEIFVERISLAQRISELVDRFTCEPQCRFADIFGPLRDRQQVIITFLAILEMIKLKMLTLEPGELMEEIRLCAAFAEQPAASTTEPQFTYR